LNQKGVAHSFLALVMAFFVLIGVWYVHKSYEQKQLKENLTQVYSDYRTWAMMVVKDAKDRERVEVLFREIDGIVAKYQSGSTVFPSHMDTTKK
jgi:hypothetical protein